MPNRTQNLRGSRKHIIELLDHAEGIEKLNQALQCIDARIAPDRKSRPSGSTDDGEVEIPGFCAEYCRHLIEASQVDGWWLPKGRREKGATWDLLSTCLVRNKPGILLVEGKAHEDELEYGGKLLQLTASLQSKRNHRHIEGALREASQALDQLVDGLVSLSITNCYQLANRIAWAWKLADSGLRVVLLYLGFTGDTYFRDYFASDMHWQRAMGAYMRGVIPLDLPGKQVCLPGRGEMTFLVKSLPVANVSA